MNVLIVGRTIMSGTSRCLGGIAHDGTSLRLLRADGSHWDTTAPFKIGDVWDVAYHPVGSPNPPHTEDVLVSKYQLVGPQKNLRTHLLNRVDAWRGGINRLFGGVLGYTASNNGFVCQRLGVPAHSTWFWIPDRELTLRADSKHYDYPEKYSHRGLSYVGEPQPLPTLPAETLVRVSLARWWRQDEAQPDFEERCYLQLSGWFL